MNFRTYLKDEFQMGSVPSKTFLDNRFDIFFVKGMIVYEVDLHYLAILWDLSTLCVVDQLWQLVHEHIYILGWSAVDQSLLGKNQQGAFRRIWKTFCTVAINQVTLVCMIPWCCKSIHYPDKFLQRVIFFPKNLAWDASLLSKKYGGLLINQWNLRKSEAGSEATS